MQDRVGFIGLGAMGGTLLKGLLDGGVEPGNIVAADVSRVKMDEAVSKFGIEAADPLGVAKAARVIFIAVKPQDMEGLVQNIAPVLLEGQVLVSVAAGISIVYIEKYLENNVGVIRVMPNTPCLVGEGAMAVSGGKHVSKEDLHRVCSWLETLGIVRIVPEKLMNAVTGLSGSGPAFVYMMIEALADGGVLNGMPRALSLELAAQTVLGAAKMVIETGEHPAVLREMVTSPGGTSAAGLYALEDGGFRATVQKAVTDASERSKELGNS